MPKSFMIRHSKSVEAKDTLDESRACQDDARGSPKVFCQLKVITNQEVHEVEDFTEEGYKMTSREGKQATKTTEKTDVFEGSPEYRNRRLVSQKSLDKSSSDGESDSGYSSLNEGRRELPVEVEDTLGCPSSVAFLFDLMTQSPQRNSGRDVLDLSCEYRQDDACTDKLIIMEQQRLQGKEKVEISSVSSPGEFSFPAARNYFSNAPYPALVKSADDKDGKYTFEMKAAVKFGLQSTPQKKEAFADCLYYGNAAPSQYVAMTTDSPMNLHQSNSVAVDTAPMPSSSENAPLTHAQRKICFDRFNPRDLSPLRVAAPFFANDEPIDYSQLSSRRRYDESVDSRGLFEKESNGYGCKDGTERTGLRRNGGEALDVVDSKSLVSRHRFEFILTPQLSADGRVVVASSDQHHFLNPQRRQSDKDKKGNTGIKHPCQNALAPSVFDSRLGGRGHSSPLSASPASLVDYSYEGGSGASPGQRHYARQLQPVAMETDESKEDVETMYRKMAYHPKLKYLLASSQNRSPTRQPREIEQSPTSTSHGEENNSALLTFSTPKGVMEEPVEQTPVQIYRNQANEYSQDTRVDMENATKDSQVIEGNLPTILAQNQYIYTDLHKGSNKINSNPFSMQTHPGTSSEPISSIIAQLNHISQADDKSIVISSSSSSHSDHISPSSHHSINPIVNVNRQSPLSLCMSTSPPLSSSSSPSSLLNSSRDQQSALTELLFSTSTKPTLDPYACTECGKRYSTSSNLARHRQTHRSVCDKKARKCPHCEKVYVSMPAFSMHVRTHNQGCECPHCGKKFSRPWLLQGHIRTHTGEKPFGCPQCGKSFADKSNLRAHIQTHSTEKPYVCGRCGKAFALKSYLYKHEESSCMRGQRFRN